MNEKGFTLIEVLSVVFILMVVALVAIPGGFNMLKRQEKKEIDITENVIINAAKVYYAKNGDVREDLSNNGDYVDVSILTLANDKLLDLPIKNPVTDADISTSLTIRIINNNGTISYIFSLE